VKIEGGIGKGAKGIDGIDTEFLGDQISWAHGMGKRLETGDGNRPEAARL
jgi:hypothetical protein